MKKFLLFAVAALTAVSVSAQKLSTKKNASTKAKSSMVMKHLQNHKVDVNKAMPASAAFGLVNAKDMKMLSNKSIKNLTPVSNRAMAPAKVGQLQQIYNGSCTDYVDKVKVEWTLCTGQAETGELLMADVCPNPFVENGIDEIDVEYTIANSIITIQPQLAVTSSAYFIYFAGATADGSVTLTLGEDGSLSTEDEIGYYVMNRGEEFSAGAGLGWWDLFMNITYLMEGEEPPAVTEILAEYEPEGLYLHMGLSRSFYGYNNNLSMVPAYAPVSFKNFTLVDGATFSWSVENLETEETITGNTKDFSFETVGGDVYSPAVLKASVGDVEGTYTWGIGTNKTAGYLYAGATGDSYDMSDGTMSIITKCNPEFSIAYYGFLATPDKNSNNYSIRNLYLYQGKPSAPLYCEGITYLVRDFESASGIELTCQIRKFTRTASGAGTLGDVIYESSTVEFVEGDTPGIGEIQFTDFYTYDEDGMTVSADHMFIDEEFCVAILGWDNGTFSCNPYGEYDYNENGVTSTFISMTPDGVNYQEGNMLRFGSLYSHQYVGFMGAAYGWLKTEQPTDITISAEGGEAVITVTPMLCSVDNETGAHKTRLFLDDNCEVPEWLEVGIANEDYEENFTFDLVVMAEALPEGEEAREATLVFWQEGAQLVLNVKQDASSAEVVKGDVNGDGTVDIADLNIIIDKILGETVTGDTDVDGNGVTEVLDLNLVIDIILGGE